MYRNAIDADSQAIKLDKDDKGAYYNLGQAFMDSGDFHGAEDAFKKVIEIDPGFRKAYVDLIECLEKNGTVKEALKWENLKNSRFGR
jgi:tetratricopeptide (TPR) repeat protein